MIDRQTLRQLGSTGIRTAASVQSARHVVQTAISRLLLLIGLLGTAGAQAHLMTAQRGTLNFVDTGAFMVLSLPVTAFPDVDHDGNQLLSITEFEAGRHDMMTTVQREVQLLDPDGTPRPLEGLLLSPAASHDAPAAPVSQVVVMGRFSLAEADGSYRFAVGLYGATAEEQMLQIQASRPAAAQTQRLQLTPEHASGELFTSQKVQLDPDLFDREALVGKPRIVDCTLSDGRASSCASITVRYKPDNLSTGPFCPSTVDDVGGIWNWDGEQAGLYRVDGDFLRMLDELGYHFFDASGNVNIVDLRMGQPAVANACLSVSADETVEMTMLIPTTPVDARAPTTLGTVAQVGLALDGVPIFADAPSVLDRGHMPALDPCGGHIDPGGWYHWHATATDIDQVYRHDDVDADCTLAQSSAAQFGYAFDGYPMFGSTEFDGSTPEDLDECNGHVSPTAARPEGEYHYHAALEFPNLPGCLKGLQARNNFTTTAAQGIGSARGGPGPQGGPGGDGNGPPNLADVATGLGVEAADLRNALEAAGGPGADLAEVADVLGIDEQALRQALPPPRR